jgi:hypothetical protein
MYPQMPRAGSDTSSRSGRSGSAKEGPIPISGTETSFALFHEKSIIRSHIRSRTSSLVIAFLPRWSLLSEPPEFSVHTDIYRKAFFDAVWFIWVFIPLEIIERLHEMGIMPVFFGVPLTSSRLFDVQNLIIETIKII